MKKALLSAAITFVVVLATHCCARAAEGKPEALAEAFVDLLAKEDFTTAVARFDTTMLAAFPEPKLRDTWHSLTNQVGPFKQRLHSKTLKVGAYDVVLVTSEFGLSKLDVKVVFNSKLEVSGLFFVPSAGEAEQAGPPPYANTNAFRERPYTVGSGEWSLPGTLTVPLSKQSPAVFPAVILVHGSGPNDRDETVGMIKLFRDLAWGLATKGVAVLRYEKRTREHGAKLMKEANASFTLREETIDDAARAAEQLRQAEGVDPKRIFVLGHSLGGLAAPRIAQANTNIAGLIIMAGSTRPLEDLIVEQTRYILSLKGAMSPADKEKLRQVESEAAAIKKLTAADASSVTQLFGAPASYWLDLRTYNPAAEAKLLKQPLLIMQGGRDYQVAQADFKNWKTALAGMSNVTFKVYLSLNHLFVSGAGQSSPQEYQQPGHVTEAVVDDIAIWIKRGSLTPKAE